MDEQAVRAALQHHREAAYSMEAWGAPERRARWRPAPPRQDGGPASDPAADADAA